MALFHSHQWVEQSRHSVPPVSMGVKVKWCSERFMERMVCGVTVIVLRCADCGDLKTIEMIGDAKPGPR